MERLTIGRLAQQSGVHVETIRYYQRKGLLKEPEKPRSGFRSYPADAVRHVRFIKRAQALGFTLKEIRHLLALEETRACAETQALATQKLAVLEEKLADMLRLRKALTRLVRACEATPDDTSCPIIHLLADD